MKSKQMIAALAADRTRSPDPLRSIAAALLAGSILAAVFFTLGWNVRPDFEMAIQRADFVFKFVVTMSVSFSTLAVLAVVVRPARQARVVLLAIGPGILALGVLIELATTPAESWGARTVGENAVLCLMSIPALALAPFACLFYAVRRGAPTRPRFAGALCALAAAAIGATLYAAHCTDDSPLFVAVWYSTAIAIATAIGSVIGARWLRW